MPPYLSRGSHDFKNDCKKIIDYRYGLENMTPDLSLSSDKNKWMYVSVFMRYRYTIYY